MQYPFCAGDNEGMLLDGVHVPLTTPFYPDGRVYLRKLEHNVRRYSLAPVHGLIALGGNAEAALLNTPERLEVLRTVAETAAADKVLTAGIAEAGVLPALQLAEAAADLRYDVVLLMLPSSLAAAWHHRTPSDGTSSDSTPSIEALTWFRSIADRSALPVLLATVAAGRPLPISTLAELADHPNVLGFLEPSNHIGRVRDLRSATAHIRRSATTTITFTAATGRMLSPAAAQGVPGASGAFISADTLAGGAAIAVAPEPPALKTRRKEVGSQVLWSHAANSTEALRAGASGLAPAIAASVPEAVFEVWAAWKDGDTSLMDEKQGRVERAEPFFLDRSIAAVKAGAELSGYFGGRPRLPLLPLTAADQAQMASLLDGMRS